MSEQVSVREFARRMGVSHPSIVKAHKSGRLRRSMGVDAKGRAVILDAALAAEEWAANTSRPLTTEVVTAVVTTPVTTVTTPPEAPADDVEDEDDQDDGSLFNLPALRDGKKLVDAQLNVANERARALRRDHEERLGKLVLKEDVVRQQFEIARRLREAMLNLVPQLAAELAAEKDPRKVHTRMDAAIRQALASAAMDLQAGANG